MTRARLPDRRMALTEKVLWNNGTGPDHKLLATFGFDPKERRIKEIFVASFRAEAAMVALANDACILCSRLLQRGDTVEELAQTFSGEESAAPASMIGAIARKAAEVQLALDSGEIA